MAYEIAYMKWYCKHNKRLFLTYLLAAAVLLFVLVYLSLLDFKKSETAPLIGPAILVLALNVMMSILTPLYQFRYVMNKRSVDLYYPLPMKKTTMFWLNYVIGMVFICIPNLLFLVSFLWVVEIRAYFALYLILMAVFALMSFATYAMATFFVLKCNSFWDACFASGAVMLIQILLVAAVSALLSDVTNEVLVGGGAAQEFFPVRIIESFSTLITGINLLTGFSYAFHEVIEYGGNLLDIWCSQSGLGISLVLYYLVIFVVFSILACSAYRKRKGEDSEQKTTSKLVYPLFISLITITLLFHNSTSFSFFWFTIVLFFLMNSLAERKIVIRLKMIGYLMLYGVSLFLITQLMISTKGFGRIHEYYEPSEVRSVRIELHYYEDYNVEQGLYGRMYESANVTMYDYQRDQELIQQVVALHHRVLGKEDEYAPVIGNVAINYDLENGMVAYRYFNFSKEDEALINQMQDYLIENEYAKVESITNDN